MFNPFEFGDLYTYDDPECKDQSGIEEVIDVLKPGAVFIIIAKNESEILPNLRNKAVFLRNLHAKMEVRDNA